MAIMRKKSINVLRHLKKIATDLSEEEAKNARDMYGYIKTISVEL